MVLDSNSTPADQPMPQVPRGYEVQELSPLVTKYIEPKVLIKWLKQRRKEFGNNFAVETDRSSDQHIIVVKRKLTEPEIDEIKQLSYPERFNIDNIF